MRYQLSMVEVLLVNPYVLVRHEPRKASYRPYPPLGLMYLGSVLREAGFSVEIYDGTFSDDPDRILERLKHGPAPKVVGIFAMNSFRDDALKTIEHVRAQTDAFIFAGGPDPSIYDGEYLEGGVDVVVRGEGEIAILELLEAYGLKPGQLGAPRRPQSKTLLDIVGVSILNDGKLERAQDRPASKTMDDLPSPAYDLIDLHHYADEWRRVHGYASIQFMTSRGCPFSCTWCARPIFGRRYRQYSAERAVEEIAHLYETYGFQHLWLFDDTFVVRRQWVEAFCDALLKRGLKVRWECLARVDLVDYGLLKHMRDAGCERINFGFESGSQRVLDGMKKGITVEDARRVAAAMHDLGVTMGGYVLMGYPGEEWEDIQKTVGLIRDIQPVDYSTSVAMPMPGTEFFDLVHDMMLKDKKWADQDSDAVIWESPYSRGFYRIVESLMHAEYDLGLEFSVKTFVKSKVLKSVLLGMRTMGDGKKRLSRYRDERFKGWRGLRKPEHSARHRTTHAKKAEAKRSNKPLRVLS